jgi:hypothetical protein
VIFKALLIQKSANKFFKKNIPKCLIFSNDHSPSIRAILHEAKRQKVPTIYLQHASVSDNFPPLIFDLSLLEGQDSFDKYKICGISGSVKLIGMPKADKYLQYRKPNRRVESIGIGISILDKVESIYNLVAYITEKYKHIAFYFRKHPRDTRVFKFSESINISDSLKESSFDFLLKCDILIAGVTSMHLEATMLNIPSIYHDLKGFYYDYYGYAKRNLCFKCDNLESVDTQIKEWLEETPTVYQRAKYYNATIGTPHEGKSIELALNEISAFIN